MSQFPNATTAAPTQKRPDAELVSRDAVTELLNRATEQATGAVAAAPQPEADSRWKTVKLPSFGAHYGGKLPDGMLQIRNWTTAEESVIASQTTSAFEKASYLLRSCVRVPVSFSYQIGNRTFSGVDGLLTSDRGVLLFLQRQLSMGGKYEMGWQCGSCRQVGTAQVDIDQFVFDTPDDVRENFDKNPSWGEYTTDEPFTLHIPEMDTHVHWRFLRGSDEAEIFQHAQRMRMQNTDPADPSTRIRIARMLVGVDSVPEWDRMNDTARMKWLQDKHIMLTKRIEAAAGRRSTGIRPQVPAKCGACGTTTTLMVGFDIDFFRSVSV